MLAQRHSPLLLLVLAIGFQHTAAATTVTTSISLTSSSNPSVYGHEITLSATVSAGSGKVTFFDGVTVLGTATLSGGTAVFTTVLPQSGTRSLTARYEGSTGYEVSTSPVLTETVTTIPVAGFVSPLSYLIDQPGFFTGDFNGDGKEDIAYIYTNVAYYDFSYAVVLLGNGDGTFQQPLNSPIGSALDIPFAAIGDFNQDGRLDFVFLSSEKFTETLLPGNGDGTFASPVTYYPTANTDVLSVADVNGDGVADLVTTAGIMLGKGDGSFQPLAYYNALYGTIQTMAVGDFNLDGKPDVLVATVPNEGAATPGGIFLLLNNGNGTFAPPGLAIGSHTEGKLLMVADFNGDGKPDFAVVDSVIGNYQGYVTVFPGNGDGTFGTGIATKSVTAIQSAAVGDFNGDGKPDLAVTANDAIDILLGKGDGTFQPPVEDTAPTNFGSIVVFDFNGDGLPDIAGSASPRGGFYVDILLGYGSHTSSTLLTSYPNPSADSQPVTLTATISPASATGTVTFLDGSAALGTSKATSGVATLIISNLAPGSHVLAAEYSGDSFNVANTSPAITQTVLLPPTSTSILFTSSISTSILGQAVTLTAHVTPSGDSRFSDLL